MKPNGYLSVKNWTDFQHYSKRNPPWIKMHRDLLYDYEFRCLPDNTKSHLMLIWLLASQIGNKIPNDPDWIRERIGCHEIIDVTSLIQSGFLIADSNALAYIKSMKASRAIPETETETETEEEKISPPPIVQVKKPRAKMATKQKRFREFYDAYPKHVAAKVCEKYWEKEKLDDQCDLMLTDIERRKQHDQKWAAGFIKEPINYLKEERWNDEISGANSNGVVATPVSAETPRSRHEKALKRKHGTDNGETLGEDARIVW